MDTRINSHLLQSNGWTRGRFAILTKRQRILPTFLLDRFELVVVPWQPWDAGNFRIWTALILQVTDQRSFQNLITKRVGQTLYLLRGVRDCADMCRSDFLNFHSFRPAVPLPSGPIVVHPRAGCNSRCHAKTFHWLSFLSYFIQLYKCTSERFPYYTAM